MKMIHFNGLEYLDTLSLYKKKLSQLIIGKYITRTNHKKSLNETISDLLNNNYKCFKPI